MKLIIVRQGVTDHNVNKIIQGYLYIPLITRRLLSGGDVTGLPQIITNDTAHIIGPTGLEVL